MATVKQVKDGEVILGAPIYKSKAYVYLNKEGAVLGTINTAAEVKNIWTYYDHCEIQVRCYDLHLNDNTKL